MSAVRQRSRQCCTTIPKEMYAPLVQKRWPKVFLKRLKKGIGSKSNGALRMLSLVPSQDTNERLRFKLHLRPAGSGSEDLTEKLPPLPPNKEAVDILGDYLKYLYTCSRTYIQESHANGIDLWNSVVNDIHFVLSHPNGWEGIQQSRMRKAALLAGLVPDAEAGLARISFVTEGEASLHFAINHGLPPEASSVRSSLPTCFQLTDTCSLTTGWRSSTQAEERSILVPTAALRQEPSSPSRKLRSLSV